MKMDLIMAFSVILIVMAIGDFISAKTKAFVPSVFVCAVLFLFGYWTFFPKDIVTVAGLGMPVAQLGMYLLITHMGTMMSIKELAAQWKTILIAAIGIAGICLGTLTIGAAMFGWQAAVAATPSLTGGVVASLVMSEGATKLNLPHLAVLAILVYATKGFFGYPITAWMLKKEGNRLLGLLRSGKSDWKAKSETAVTAVVEKSKFRLIPPFPEKYNSTYMHLMRLGLVAWASVAFATSIKDAVSKYVICLIFGVIAAEIGIVDRKPLNTAGAFGFLITSLMAFVFDSLQKATPAMVAQVAGPLLVMVIVGIIGMAILSIALSKILGETIHMGFAIALSALFGFPPTYILTEEVSKALGENKDEYNYLMDKMLPKMLVGGFTTVTILSVIIAGIFVKML